MRINRRLAIIVIVTVLTLSTCIIGVILLIKNNNPVSTASTDITEGNTDEAAVLPTNKPSTIPSASAEPTDSPAVSPSTSLSEESFALETYRSILENKTNFYSSEEGKEISLNDFLVNGESGYETELVLTHFAIVDLDEDQISEMVLDLSFPGSEYTDLYEVLHYVDGSVSGYLLPYRGLLQLKEDGTFMYSNGSADWGIANLKFTTDGYEYSILGYSESTNTGAAFYIDNEPSAEDQFNEFNSAQEDKADVQWYEFTPAGIEAGLSKD